MNAPLESLGSAIVRLREVLDLPPSDVVRDAAIQRFEFCFELAWKAAQQRLRREGLDCASPRSCLQAAYRQGWIEEGPWLEMLGDRNLTSHTYDQSLAEQVFLRLPRHVPQLEALYESLRREA